VNDAVAIDHEKRSLAGAFVFAIGAIEPRNRALRLEVGEERKM